MRHKYFRVAALALSSSSFIASPFAWGGDISFDGSLPGTTAGALAAINGTFAVTQDRRFVNGTNLHRSGCPG